MPDYTDKVDRLLAVATTLGFTEQDFADLALAAADQAGASSIEQSEIAGALGVAPYTVRRENAAAAAFVSAMRKVQP